MTSIHSTLKDIFNFPIFFHIVVVVTFIIVLAVIFLWDVNQRSHSVLRNYPVIGHIRYILEHLGVYLRQYFYSMDREELPFNRAERNWVYRAAKNVDNMTAFGSTRDLHPAGTVYFVNAPFAVLGQDSVEAHLIILGPHTKHPYSTNSFFNISAMSYGALSKAAITALSHGAKKAGCWLNTGEGGLSSYHLSGKCDLIFQIGTAKYGVRNEAGELDDNRLRKIAAHDEVKMFEVKLSQGAKPGKGGLLPGIKVTPEISEIRGIPVFTDSISPNRFPEIANVSQLLDFINHVRDVTEKPTGCKFVLGSPEFLDELCIEIVRRGEEFAPDFITLDSSDGGTGAAPASLMDYVGLPISESLPLLVDTLIKYRLRDRIKIIASGKLITPAEVAWALCVGADFINSARGFLFSLGCIQALRCHLNTCPTGVTTHNPHLMRGLVPQDKAERVFHYATNMTYEVGVISHSCGVREPRDLTRAHARIVLPNTLSCSLADLYPPVKPLSLRELEKIREREPEITVSHMPAQD